MAVSEQIIQVLDALCDKFGLVVDWTSENVVPYLSTLCTKLVSYEIWTSVAWIVICTILSTIGIIIWSNKNFRLGLDNIDIGPCTMATIFVICWVTSLILVIMQIMDIIKCVTFPEMYIFEYVQRILNGG
jgi:hypothetical protein